jgi:hypothetical protein
MKLRLAIAATFALAALTGCRPRESEQQREHDANTVAGKLGQAAHRAAVEADKASRALSRQLGKAAHDAHEGWQQDERKRDQAKPRDEK